MTKESEKFERKIERIYRLLKGSEATVTWNDKIPDPDNPSQLRQIDITIKKDNWLTLVECRLHKKKQDVKWIEELIGRRQSLKADLVVAVSSSGFTKGAIQKAKTHNIVLRDILSLEDEEIKLWEDKIELIIKYYQFSKTHILFHFDASNDNQITTANLESFANSNPEKLLGIFEGINSQLRKSNFNSSGSEQEILINCKIAPDKDFQINSFYPHVIIFNSFVKLIEKRINAYSVSVYGHPEDQFIDRNTFIQESNLGDSEIITINGDLALRLDLSVIDPPFNSCFSYMLIDCKRPMRLKIATVNPLKNTTDLQFNLHIRLDEYKK